MADFTQTVRQLIQGGATYIGEQTDLVTDQTENGASTWLEVGAFKTHTVHVVIEGTANVAIEGRVLRDWKILIGGQTILSNVIVTDEGGGTIGLHITSHGVRVGAIITLVGTGTSYDGAQVAAATTTADLLVITDTFSENRIFRGYISVTAATHSFEVATFAESGATTIDFRLAELRAVVTNSGGAGDRVSVHYMGFRN